MSIEPFEHLIVDPQDLDCGICYFRYTPITNEPMIMIPCEHSICSSCFKNIKGSCPFCKGEISQNLIRNQLLSSLLERDSQVKKCPVHKQPMDFYCKEDYKLACSQCVVKKNPERFGSVQEIHSKMEEKRKAFQKLQNEKQETVKMINERISQGAQNLKRKLDDLFDERLAQDLAKQKRLKSSLDVIMFTEKEQYEHQLGSSKYEEDYKRLENWKNSPEENNIVERIFKTSLSTKQAVLFYNEKAKEIFRNIADIEKNIEKIILESKNENSLNFFEEISEKVHANARLDPKHRQEIAREYLLNTFEEQGILANYQKEEDSFELKDNTQAPKLKKFNQNLFECSIEKLCFSCSLISHAKFTVLCEILQHTQSLSNLNLSLLGPSPRKVDPICNLVLSSKTLRNFSFRMPLFLGSEELLKGYLQNVLNSQRICHFSLGCIVHHSHFIDFQQDLVLFPARTKKSIEEFSAKFIGNFPLSNQIFHIISNALKKTKSLRKVQLSFGDRINYTFFIQELCEVLRKSIHNLQELDLGFANVRFLNSCLGQQIFQVIINSKELRKLSLFLVGNELSDDLFDDLFYVEKGKVSKGHKLEDFSLTIMQCDDVDLDLDGLVEFLRSFSQLKRFNLRINRVALDFQRITDFLENILQLKSLVSFDFALRDFGRLTAKKKKDLDICRYRLSLYKIQHKIVFEQLRPEHLPDYVSFASEGEGEEEEDDEEEEEEEEEIEEEIEEEEEEEVEEEEDEEDEEEEEDEDEENEEEEDVVVEISVEDDAVVEISEENSEVFDIFQEDFEVVEIIDEEEDPHEEKIDRRRPRAARCW